MCLSCIIDNRMIYLLNVDKCMHLVNGEIRSNFIRFGYEELLSSLLKINALKMLLILFRCSALVII